MVCCPVAAMLPVWCTWWEHALLGLVGLQVKQRRPLPVCAQVVLLYMNSPLPLCCRSHCCCC
jgi:hypothetical protein